MKMGTLKAIKTETISCIGIVATCDYMNYVENAQCMQMHIKMSAYQNNKKFGMSLFKC